MESTIVQYLLTRGPSSESRCLFTRDASVPGNSS